MKKCLFAAFVLLSCVLLHAQDIPKLKPLKDIEGALTPAEKKGQWGYVNEKGKFVINAVFDEARPFVPLTGPGDVTMPVAKIRVGNLWGYITRENVYLFQPAYESLTDFDGAANAVGTANGTSALLGVAAATSEKGGFQTLTGTVLADNLSGLGPFNANGLAWARKNGLWGMMNRKGEWTLSARYDSYETLSAEGLTRVTKAGKSGAVDAKGKQVIPLSFDALEWNAATRQIVARKGGKYGTFDAYGQVIYACLFDEVPVPGADGYIPFWKDGRPAAAFPGQKYLSLEEFDDQLYNEMTRAEYLSTKKIPEWAKMHKEPLYRLVTVQSDLPDMLPICRYDKKKFAATRLQCGKTLAEALSPLLQEDECAGAMSVCDAGDFLYVGWEDEESRCWLLAIDLTGGNRTWTAGPNGDFVCIGKSRIVAWDGFSRSGMDYAVTPTAFDYQEGAGRPVIRYEFHSWAGKPEVYVGHNIFPFDPTYKSGWRVRAEEGKLIDLGDFSPDEGLKQEGRIMYLRIGAPGPDGIARYELLSREVMDGEWEQENRSLNFNKSELFSEGFGYVGLSKPFFTQPLFTEARDIRNGYGEVLLDGTWKKLSLAQLAEMDPFIQPGDKAEGKKVRAYVMPDKNVGMINDLSKPLSLPGNSEFEADEIGRFGELAPIRLKCGRSLARVLDACMYKDGSPAVILDCYDTGDFLFLTENIFEGVKTLTCIDLRAKPVVKWEATVTGSGLFDVKTQILSETGYGYSEIPVPVKFTSYNGKNLPVLRYEYQKGQGAFVGHNKLAEDTTSEDERRIKVSAPGTVCIHDPIAGDNSDFANLYYIKVSAPGPDGIATYQVDNVLMDYTEYDSGVKRKETTYSYGFIGITRPFFTEPLFEDVRDIENGSGKVKIDGKWATLSLGQIKDLDPFVQP